MRPSISYLTRNRGSPGFRTSDRGQRTSGRGRSDHMSEEPRFLDRANPNRQAKNTCTSASTRAQARASHACPLARAHAHIHTHTRNRCDEHITISTRRQARGPCETSANVRSIHAHVVTTKASKKQNAKRTANEQARPHEDFGPRSSTSPRPTRDTTSHRNEEKRNTRRTRSKPSDKQAYRRTSRVTKLR